MGRKQNYEKCVVVFIDILGFAQLVSQGDFSKIRSIVGSLKWQLEPRIELVRNTSGTKLSDREIVSPKAIFFSDNVVITCPLGEKDELSAIVQVLCRVKMAQMKLATQGIWVRGGVTVGPLFHKRYSGVARNDDMIFGPALVDAYRIESKIAKYPRIVLDDEIGREIHLGKELIFEHYEGESERFDGSDLIAVDKDGRYYIDFLSRVISFFEPVEDHHLGLDVSKTVSIGELMTHGSDYQNDLYTRSIERIGNVLGMQQSKISQNVEVQEKLNWIKHYIDKYM